MDQATYNVIERGILARDSKRASNQLRGTRRLLEGVQDGRP